MVKPVVYKVFKFAKFTECGFILINLLIFLVRIVFGLVIAVVIGILTKKFLWDRENLSSFECGFNSKDQGLLPFRFRFYLLANIFLVFDIELILLFPFMVKFLVNGL